MALATRCPHCATTFRVAHDQLKLRAGLVRCGACKQIFNGVENLVGPDLNPGQQFSPPKQTPRSYAPPAASREAALPPGKANSGTSAPASGVPSSAGTASPSSLILSPPTTAFPSPASSASETDDKDVDPLTRMTLMDFTAFAENNAALERASADSTQGSARSSSSDTEAPDEIDQAIADLHSKPWRGDRKNTQEEKEPADDSLEEPGFVKHARRRQKVGTTLKWVYGLGSLMLALALAGQLTYAFRDQLAQRVPQAAPLLQQACGHLDCRIDFPAPVHALTIESSELQALPAQPDTYLLRALLRNRYDTTVAWPHLELTLNDIEERAVARRSFSPAEYLTSTEQVQAGFSSQSEQVVRVNFVLQGAQASGFRVYLFYP